MGGKNSTKKLNPKSVNELKHHVDVEFSKDEIQAWYKEFRKSLLRGESELTKNAFIEVYNKLFDGDATEFAEQVFRTFDRDGNDSVDFNEFILGFCISGSDDPKKKLKWAFKMYDIDQDGYISMEEMTHILKAVCKMTSGQIPPQYSSAEDLTMHIFSILDKNADNGISLEEFIEGANTVQILVDILQIDPGS